ncbi:hypothetical protein JOE46_000848 [Rhodococcus sp. PvR099]|nr:hypothetical protein [Rhodococcus sp. PvR099]
MPTPTPTLGRGTLAALMSVLIAAGVLTAARATASTPRRD